MSVDLANIRMLRELEVAISKAADVREDQETRAAGTKSTERFQIVRLTLDSLSAACGLAAAELEAKHRAATDV